MRDDILEECAQVLEQIYKKGTVECGIAYSVAGIVRELKSRGVNIEEQLSEIIEHLRTVQFRLKNQYKPEEEWPL